MTTPSTVAAYLPPGQAAALRSTTESVVGCSAATSRTSLLKTASRAGLSSGHGAPSGCSPSSVHGAVRNTMRAPGRRHELGRQLQLLLHVGGVGRVQDVGPGALVLPVDHLPATGQEHDHVGLDLVDGRPATGPATAGCPPARPATSGDPLQAGGVGVAGPHELDLGPVHHAAAEDPLVREDVAVLVLVAAGTTSPTPRVSATESPKRRTRTGCGGRRRPGQRRRRGRRAAGAG